MTSYPLPESPHDQVIELPLAPVPQAVSYARHQIRDQLIRWSLSNVTETLELAASELVTNSFKAVAGISTGKPDLWKSCGHLPITTRLRLTDSAVYLEVWDAVQTQPTATSSHMYDESGRGLELVGALCDDWGFFPDENGGKVTWCCIKRPATAEALSRRSTSGYPASTCVDAQGTAPIETKTARRANTQAIQPYDGNGTVRVRTALTCG